MTRNYSLLTGLATLCLFGLSGSTAWGQQTAPSVLQPSPAAATPGLIADAHGDHGHCATCSNGACGGACGAAQGCRLHAQHACRADACGCGRGRGLGAGCGHGLGCGCHGCGGQGSGHVRSGQPLVDPWMRADWRAAQQSAVRSWHAGYYNTQYGAPVALMVPPTARMQTRWGWGVSQSTMSPIYHQFERPYPGPVVGDGTGMGTNPLLPTPRWPSHTDQFGVYYVRGPW